MPTMKTAANETANEIARERARYLALAAKYGMTDDVREGLRFVELCETRWNLENPNAG